MATTMTLETIQGTKDSFKIKVDWLGDASGNATANTDDFDYMTRTITEVLQGRDITYCQTVPGTVDETYDVVITDANSQDLFTAGMSARSATLTESEFAYDGAVYGSRTVDSALDFTVSSAGDALTGSILLYVV